MSIHHSLLIALALYTTPLGADLLKRSDVIFMYQATRQTYQEYGATALAWGGKPTPQSLAEAQGITFFGSVGMVTEFARYYERFPQTYEQALCRDVHGNPVKVPWLTDHQHKGIPYWWCCTQQPQFRQYLRERVVETVKAGAQGVHIDDHLGTAGGLWTGTCFCDRCVEGFRLYLLALPEEERTKLGLSDARTFNYREHVLQWLERQGARKTGIEERPLFQLWRACQCRAAAAFMQELRELAAQAAERTVPMSANAGVLWPLHLVDYQSLDFFSAEIDHGAQRRKYGDLPLLAYRLAEAMARPLAATASGQDWAFVKENNLPGLVRGWIALSYAAGNYLMAPHRQWCYTPEKGTHWYQGPAEQFAPLYRFVRQHAFLFDEYATYADIAVVLPHRAFVKNRESWFNACGRLAASNIAYRVFLGGDDLVMRRLRVQELQAARKLLVLDTKNLDPADQKTLENLPDNVQLLTSLEQAIAAVTPVARVQAEGNVRVLARVKPGSAAIHVLNYEYQADRDAVRPIKELTLQVDWAALGLPGRCRCRWFAPEAEPIELPVRDGAVAVPVLGLWGILLVESSAG